MPLLAQPGLLINEDRLDAVTVTRNTLSSARNLNLRMTGFYAWGQVTRNSPTTQPNTFDSSSQMVGLLTESDFLHSTVNLDFAYVYGDDGDLAAFGLSGIRRHHLFHHTYNTSLHFLASYPTNGRTPFADQGELLFAQTSWTPHHSEDLIYLNGLLAIDQFTSPARGPLNGGPLGQTGILFAAPGVGRVGAPIAVRTNKMAGASLGYQMFFDKTRQQMIVEFGGSKGDDSDGAIGLAARCQKAIGQHYILILDSFVAKQESANTSPGIRSELLIRF